MIERLFDWLHWLLCGCDAYDALDDKETLEEYSDRMETYFGSAESLERLRTLKPSFTYVRGSGQLVPIRNDDEPN